MLQSRISPLFGQQNFKLQKYTIELQTEQLHPVVSCMCSGPWTRPYVSDNKMHKILHSCESRQFHITPENKHPKVSEIHILAHGQANLSQMGNNEHAHMCQRGQ